MKFASLLPKLLLVYLLAPAYSALNAMDSAPAAASTPTPIPTALTTLPTNPESPSRLLSLKELSFNAYVKLLCQENQNSFEPSAIQKFRDTHHIALPFQVIQYFKNRAAASPITLLKDTSTPLPLKLLEELQENILTLPIQDLAGITKEYLNHTSLYEEITKRIKPNNILPTVESNLDPSHITWQNPYHASSPSPIKTAKEKCFYSFDRIDGKAVLTHKITKRSSTIGQNVAVWDASCLSPNGKFFTTINREGPLGNPLFSSTLWSLEKEDPTPVNLDGHDTPIDWIIFCSNGKYMTSQSIDKSILWRIDTDTPQKIVFPHKEAIKEIDFSPDGKYMIIRPEGYEEKPYGNNTTLISTPSWAELWDLNSEEPTFIEKIKDITHICPSLGGDYAFSPKGTYLAWPSFKNLTLMNIGKKSPSKIDLPCHNGNGIEAHFSSDESYMVTSAPCEEAILWNLQKATPTKVTLSNDPKDPIRKIVFSPDGHYMATKSYSKIGLWKLEPEGPVLLMDLEKKGVNETCFSDDSNYFILNFYNKSHLLLNLKPVLSLEQMIMINLLESRIKSKKEPIGLCTEAINILNSLPTENKTKILDALDRKSLLHLGLEHFFKCHNKININDED